MLAAWRCLDHRTHILPALGGNCLLATLLRSRSRCTYLRPSNLTSALLLSIVLSELLLSARGGRQDAWCVHGRVDFQRPYRTERNGSARIGHNHQKDRNRYGQHSIIRRRSSLSRTSQPLDFAARALRAEMDARCSILFSAGKLKIGRFYFMIAAGQHGRGMNSEALITA